MIRVFVLFILSFFLARVVLASGSGLYSNHLNVRAMGMGNAYTSLARGHEALFYNPAGLASNTGFFWTLADVSLGTDAIDSYKDFTDLQDDDTFEATLNSLYGKSIWAGGGGRTAFTAPYFAAALYNDFDMNAFIDNPVSPTLDIGLINDFGIAMGVGIPVGPFLDWGVGVKRIQRWGSRNQFGPSVIADITDGDADPDIIFDNLRDKGVGYAVDTGVSFIAPTPIQPTVSFAWKNIGNTKFRPRSNRKAPPSEPQEMVIGASAKFNGPLFHVIPSIDVKHLNESSNPIGNKIHLGLEIGLPLIDIRGGVHQGYYTYGASMDFGFIRVDAATWGVEEGAYPGQRESRRYAIQLALEIGFDMGFGSSARTEDGARGERGGSASGSRGVGGGSSYQRGLKQRR